MDGAAGWRSARPSLIRNRMGVNDEAVLKPVHSAAHILRRREGFAPGVRLDPRSHRQRAHDRAPACALLAHRPRLGRS